MSLSTRGRCVFNATRCAIVVMAELRSLERRQNFTFYRGFIGIFSTMCEILSRAAWAVHRMALAGGTVPLVRSFAGSPSWYRIWETHAMKRLLLIAVAAVVLAVAATAQAGPPPGTVQLAGWGHGHHHHNHFRQPHFQQRFYRPYPVPVAPYCAPPVYGPVYRSYYPGFPGNNFYYRGPNFGLQLGW